LNGKDSFSLILAAWSGSVNPLYSYSFHRRDRWGLDG